MEHPDLLFGQCTILVGIGIIEHLLDRRHTTIPRPAGIHTLPTGRRLHRSTKPVHASLRPHAPTDSGGVLQRGTSLPLADLPGPVTHLLELSGLLFRQYLFDRCQRPRPGFVNDVADLLHLVIGQTQPACKLPVESELPQPL
jgi:hypothetical protein